MKYYVEGIKRLYRKVLLKIACVLTHKLLPKKRSHSRDGWCVTHTLLDPEINGGGIHYCSDAELVTDLLKGLYNTNDALYRIRSKSTPSDQLEL